MDKQEFIRLASDFINNSEDNIISKEIALAEDAAGTQIYEAPIIAFAAADDEYFKKLKDPAAIGEHFMLPRDWLPQAETVVSFFLPFTEALKKSNTLDLSWPSAEWMHGRIEGQALINKLCRYLQTELTNAGYASIVPGLDERFWSRTGNKNAAPPSPGEPVLTYTSNWSERHVAHVCGLGTFGLSKGLITKKGISGRIGSLITELYIPPDKRDYETYNEYCSLCGACAKNCPVNAISIEKGKDHPICSEFTQKVLAKHKPWYGCGKCQVMVPCESGIPKRSDSK